MSKLCWVGLAVAIRTVNSLEVKVGVVLVDRAATAVVIRAVNAVVNSVVEVSVYTYFHCGVTRTQESQPIIPAISPRSFQPIILVTWCQSRAF